MKKFTHYLFLLLVLAVPIGLTAQETIPYSCAFSSQAQFNTYTNLNVGDGTRSWTFSSSNGAQYWGSASNVSVWLISPDIAFESGKTYKISFKTRISSTGSSNYKNLKVTIGQGLTADVQTKVLHDMNVTSNTLTNYEAIFSLDQTGSWNVGINCYGNVTGSNDLYVKDVSIVEIPSLPLGVTELAVVPAEDESLSATVSWTNPSLLLTGEALTALTKVEVYRNDNLIHTDNSPVVGAEASHVDNTMSEAGKYTYKVIAYNDNGASTPASVTSTWIGSSTRTIPYSCGFASQEEFDFFTLENTGNGTRNWDYSSQTARYYGSATAANVWLITPKLALEAGKSYKVSFNSRVSSATSASYKNLKVTLGQGATAADQIKTLLDITVKATAMNAFEAVFYVEESGKWNIGFNCYGSTNSYDLFVDDISVVEVPTIPANITDMTVVPDVDETLSATVSWTNPATSVSGAPLAALTKVEVYRETTLIHTDESPVVGAPGSYVDNAVPAAGKYTYKVIAYNADGQTDAATALSSWIGSTTKAIPYTCAFDTQEEFDFFTLENIGDGSRGWDYSSSRARYYVSPMVSNANVWLITPNLALETGKSYKMTFKTWVSSTATLSHKNLKVTVGQGAAAASQTQTLFDKSIATTTQTEYEVIFYVGQTGKWNVGFNCYGSANSTDIFVDDISIVEVPTLPAVVTDLKVTPDAGGALSGVIEWTNPSTSVSGAALAALTEVKLFRNDELIYTNDAPEVGGAETYTDTGITESGKYTYKVITYNAEGESEAATVTSSWVGSNDVTLPYNPVFTEEENHFDRFTVVDNNGSKTWEFYTDASSAGIAYKSYSAADDWIFMPPFVGAPGDYQLIFSVKTGSGRYSEEMDVTLGKSTDPADHTNILNEGDQEFMGTYFNTKTLDFSITNNLRSDNDKYYIGYHIYTEAPYYLYIADIEVKYVGSSVSVNENEDSRVLYLNHATNLLSTGGEVALLTINNMSGTTVMQARDTTQSIDLSGLLNGVYVVKCQYVDGGSKVVKIVKR